MDIRATLSKMTDDEKIGQLFMIGVHGTEATPDSIEMVERYGVGGVILFARNVTGGAQVKDMISGLSGRAKYPLSFAIDQEGGLVMRLTTGASVMPGNMAIAACPAGERAAICREWGRIESEELRALGFTINLAPVLDVNNNPQNPGIGARSFSDRPELCAELGAKLVASVQAGGVSACAKHFPGKGNAAVDAHLDLPVINSTLDELRAFELVPFRAAISAGVDAVMTAHVVFSGIPGETLPGTLSKRILTGLLKEEMGFSGPVITDDMEMGAIAKYYPQDEACFQSFMAGCDIILICHTKELQIKTFELFKKKLASGELTRARLDDAVERILRMKSRHENHPKASLAPDLSKNAVSAASICEKALTVVSDPGGCFGRAALESASGIDIFEPKFSAITQVEDVEEHSPLFGMLAERIGAGRVSHNIFAVKLDDAGFAEAISKAPPDASGRMAVIVTYNGHLFRKQIELANRLAATYSKVVAVAVRNPYDLALIDGRAAKVATYGFRKANLTAVYRLLTGELKASGTLPVSFEKVAR